MPTPWQPLDPCHLSHFCSRSTLASTSNGGVSYNKVCGGNSAHRTVPYCQGPQTSGRRQERNECVIRIEWSAVIGTCFRCWEGQQSTESLVSIAVRNVQLLFIVPKDAVGSLWHNLEEIDTRLHQRARCSLAGTEHTRSEVRHA